MPVELLTQTLPWVVGGLILAVALAALRRPLKGLLRLAARTGVGLAVLSHSACEDYCQFGKLLAFDMQGSVLRRKLYLIRRRNGVLSPIAQVFYDYAKGFYQKPEAP